MSIYNLLGNTISPLKVKNIFGLGTVMSFAIEKANTNMSVFRYYQKCLLIIYPNGCIGKIKTEYEVVNFTPIGKDKIYYSCHNILEKSNQIRCISSNGEDTFIAGETLDLDYYNCLVDKNYFLRQDYTCFTKIKDLTTSSDGYCVILENNGIVRKLRKDGTTELLSDRFIEPTCIVSIPQGYLVSHTYGISHVKENGNISSMYHTQMPLSTSNLCQLQDTLLFFTDSKREKISVFSTEKKQFEKCLLSKAQFQKMKIGRLFRGFHVDMNGELVIWTERGIFGQQKEFILPVPLFPYSVSSSQMWNYKTVSLRNYPKELYQYARTLMLCIERFSEMEIPSEIGHIILSLADAWEFPKKSLLYWQ